jgi:hypothetical protein
MMPGTIYTLGTGVRTLDEFVALLQSNGVKIGESITPTWERSWEDTGKGVISPF